jgi:quercetin dioxygenase-like cupin family protein
MKNTAAFVLSLSLAGGTLVAQDATVRSLLSKDLAGIPGKELSMISVEYPPGGSDTVHRHHAQTLVYVLEGSIVMQVRGEAPSTLVSGQTFYEGPRRRAHRQSKRKPHRAGQVPGVLREKQGRPDSRSRDVTCGVCPEHKRLMRRKEAHQEDQLALTQSVGRGVAQSPRDSKGVEDVTDCHQTDTGSILCAASWWQAVD